jgi:hypothetical protein
MRLPGYPLRDVLPAVKAARANAHDAAIMPGRLFARGKSATRPRILAVGASGPRMRA